MIFFINYITYYHMHVINKSTYLLYYFNVLIVGLLVILMEVTASCICTVFPFSLFIFYDNIYEFNTYM